MVSTKDGSLIVKQKMMVSHYQSIVPLKVTSVR